MTAHSGQLQQKGFSLLSGLVNIGHAPIIVFFLKTRHFDRSGEI